jgi:AcrR family transcriptional regulator
VSRWAPNARERLQDAAWQLFAENGYENTTVAQIAERAGLNRATFFRHFADKREILFGGEEVIGTAFTDAVASAPAEAQLIDRLEAALAAASTVMTPEQRPRAAQRRAVAEASVEVQERGLAKNARIEAGLASALAERGIDRLTARFAAQLVMLAFAEGLRAWLEADDGKPFAQYASRAFRQLRSRARELGMAEPR